VKTRENHQVLRKKWRQDKEKDAIREANIDELRLQELIKEETSKANAV